MCLVLDRAKIPVLKHRYEGRGKNEEKEEGKARKQREPAREESVRGTSPSSKNLMDIKNEMLTEDWTTACSGYSLASKR